MNKSTFVSDGRRFFDEELRLYIKLMKT